MSYHSSALVRLGIPISLCWNRYSLVELTLAILYYDYALTFTAEVTYFWPPRNKIRWPVFLFFVNRYLVVCGHVFLILEICMFPRNASVCDMHVAVFALLMDNSPFKLKLSVETFIPVNRRHKEFLIK